MKKSSIVILISSFFLTARDLGFPRISANYNHLPKGGIREYITRIFPNKPEKEELGEMVSSHLSGDNNPENIQNVVSNMGMTCVTGKEFCKYNGCIWLRTTGGHSRSDHAKRIYRIIVSPKEGLDSLNAEKQIVRDTKKGN